MEKFYRNKEWLAGKYTDEKLSIPQISDLCKSGLRTIHKYLVRYNIPRRSYAESVHLKKGNHCKLNKNDINWIQGELLGDGSLGSRCNYSACVNYSSKYSEYIDYISNKLKEFGVKQSGKILKRVGGFKSFIYRYTSLNYEELKPLREKWYPYPKEKKIVPKDIELTPVTVRQWFIGDGCLLKAKSYPQIVFCTENFPTYDVEFLISKLKEIGIESTRWLSSNRLHIMSCSIKDFYSYIGSCPVECYKYKWRAA